MTYVVEVQPNPSREELAWAWKFTVFARAGGRCQNCGRGGRLDACHIESREARPDLEFDPDNGIALCRPCHLIHDHANGHRPSGRPVGMAHTAETKRKIGVKSRAAHGTPEGRQRLRQRALDQWERQGRKNPLRDCEGCGQPLTSRQSSRKNRYCSYACFRAHA